MVLGTTDFAYCPMVSCWNIAFACKCSSRSSASSCCKRTGIDRFAGHLNVKVLHLDFGAVAHGLLLRHDPLEVPQCKAIAQFTGILVRGLPKAAAVIVRHRDELMSNLIVAYLPGNDQRHEHDAHSGHVRYSPQNAGIVSTEQQIHGRQNDEQCK